MCRCRADVGGWVGAHLPVSKRRYEVEAAVHPVVHDVSSVQAALVVQVLLELIVDVLDDGLEAARETDGEPLNITPNNQRHREWSRASFWRQSDEKSRRSQVEFWTPWVNRWFGFYPSWDALRLLRHVTSHWDDMRQTDFFQGVACTDKAIIIYCECRPILRQAGAWFINFLIF